MQRLSNIAITGCPDRFEAVLRLGGFECIQYGICHIYGDSGAIC